MVDHVLGPCGRVVNWTGRVWMKMLVYPYYSTLKRRASSNWTVGGSWKATWVDYQIRRQHEMEGGSTESGKFQLDLVYVVVNAKSTC